LSFKVPGQQLFPLGRFALGDGICELYGLHFEFFERLSHLRQAVDRLVFRRRFAREQPVHFPKNLSRFQKNCQLRAKGNWPQLNLNLHAQQTIKGSAMRLNLTVGKKIAMGFGLVLTLLSFLAAWSYLGVGAIVGNADTVISGNQLDSILAQRETDHLNWARQLTELINNDDVVTLNIESDPRQCNLGKWLYADETAAMAADNPGTERIAGGPENAPCGPAWRRA
jgi:hypothetical protein